MVRCMKNLGYPDTIASATRFSPSSYPTLSFHVGSDTEIACGVKGGTERPNATLGLAVVMISVDVEVIVADVTTEAVV